MSPRTLSILNAIGCIVLTAVIVSHWNRERRLDQTITRLSTELGTATTRAEKEAEQRAALERDIAVLKESIEATQQAAESTSRSLAEKHLLANRLESELGAARNQVSVWEAALKTRDERIRSLDADLAATRKLLDQAIANLKTAGARQQ